MVILNQKAQSIRLPLPALHPLPPTPQEKSKPLGHRRERSSLQALLAHISHVAMLGICKNQGHAYRLEIESGGY